MSLLTRLFVLTLVVLSLVLSAATVTFVNQVDDYKTAVTTKELALKNAEARASSAESAIEAAKAQALEQVRAATTQLESAKQTMNSIQQQAVEKDAQLGQSKSALAIQAGDLTRLAEGLKSSEDTKSRLQDALNDVRGTNDKLVSQNAQLNQSVTDLTNRLDVTERERRFIAEQLTEAKNTVDRQSSLLKDAGISNQQLASATLRGSGAPAINGVIRAVKPIAGIPYATISVGSADGVERGMEFKVLNKQTGDFMGVLKVDSVELNEATGRLEGPRVGDIGPMATVKTQL